MPLFFRFVSGIQSYFIHLENRPLDRLLIGKDSILFCLIIKGQSIDLSIYLYLLGISFIFYFISFY